MAAVILYLGNDVGFVQKIQKGIQSHFPGEDIKIISAGAHSEEDIQGLILKIPAANPNLLLIDFGDNNQNFLHLSRIIKRTNGLKHIPICGLYELLSSEAFISECVLAGTTFNHRKGGDMYNILYDTVSLLFPEKSYDHGFATARSVQDAYAHTFTKVGIITRDGIQVESNLDLSPNSIIEVETIWNTQKIIPSREVNVANKEEGGRYYDFRYTYQFNFEFIDQVNKNDGDSPQDIEAREQARKRDSQFAKNTFDGWLKQNKEESSPKWIKVLTIDYQLSIYNQRKRTDRYSFVLRGQPFVTSFATDIVTLNPHIIMINLDDRPKEIPTNHAELEAYAYPNSLEMVELMVEHILDQKNFHPIIIVFNTKEEGQHEHIQDLQKKYDKLISYPGIFEPEIMDKMVDSFSKKFHPPIQNDDIFYPQKNHPSSTVEILSPIKVTSLSETDCMISTQRPFRMYETFKIILPVPLLMTVVPSKKADPAKGIYRALINAPTENEIKEIRQFINSIFFKDHDAQKMAEVEEFKKLNKKVLEQKAEEQRKAQEKAQKEAELAKLTAEKTDKTPKN